MIAKSSSEICAPAGGLPIRGVAVSPIRGQINDQKLASDLLLLTDGIRLQ